MSPPQTVELAVSARQQYLNSIADVHYLRGNDSPRGTAPADQDDLAGVDRFLRISAVKSLVGLSVPTIYRLIAKGEFPRPIKLTKTASGWKLSAINRWMDVRAARSEGSADGSEP